MQRDMNSRLAPGESQGRSAERAPETPPACPASRGPVRTDRSLTRQGFRRCDRLGGCVQACESEQLLDVLGGEPFVRRRADEEMR